MHSVVSSNITKSAQLRNIRQLSNRELSRWLSGLILDWLIISSTLTLALMASSLPIYALAFLVVGNRQHAIGILGHDGAHFSIHRSKKANDLLANIFCFWPMLLTVSGYRALHANHHKHTGSSLDPELMHKAVRAPQWDLPLSLRRVSFYALKDLCGFALPDFFIIIAFSKPKRFLELLPVVVMHAAFVTTCVFLHVWQIAALWYGSLIGSFMMFFRLRLWLEHQGTQATHRLQLSYVEGAVFAPHHIFYHWEHHEFPSIPHFQLPSARKLLSGPAQVSLAELIHKLQKSPKIKSGKCISEPADA